MGRFHNYNGACALAGSWQHDYIAANVKLLIEQLEAGHSEGDISSFW
jgi:hypothetical protein